MKGAAALALGGVAVGALSVYLPPLLAAVAGRAGAPKEQYLLLRALNEVITSLLALADGGAKLQAAAGDQVRVIYPPPSHWNNSVRAEPYTSISYRPNK